MSVVKCVTKSFYCEQNIRIFNCTSGGRCYDHNFCDFQQFSAKKLAFLSKTNVMIKILHNLPLFWVKNANFFTKFFGENILKIITSVPVLWYVHRKDAQCAFRTILRHRWLPRVEWQMSTNKKTKTNVTFRRKIQSWSCGAVIVIFTQKRNKICSKWRRARKKRKGVSSPKSERSPLFFKWPN
jgi:hypothetical protein